MVVENWRDWYKKKIPIHASMAIHSQCLCLVIIKNFPIPTISAYPIPIPKTTRFINGKRTGALFIHCTLGGNHASSLAQLFKALRFSRKSVLGRGSKKLPL